MKENWVTTYINYVLYNLERERWTEVLLPTRDHEVQFHLFNMNELDAIDLLL